MRVHPPRAAVLPLAALAVAAGVAACGSSGYQYVENDELGVYAKVPDDWTVYDEDALFPDDSELERAQRLSNSWIRRFDASDEPSVDHATSPDAAAPTGRIEVFRLSADGRNQINLSQLRGIAVGNPQADPLVVATQDPSVTVVIDEPVTFDGGYHGVHTVFRVDPSAAAAPETEVAADPSADRPPFVVDQTTVLDATSSRAYIFQVSCSEECYVNTHKDAIADIVDSWTIQEVR